MGSPAVKGVVSDRSNETGPHFDHQLDQAFGLNFSILDRYGAHTRIRQVDGGSAEILDASGGAQGILFASEAVGSPLNNNYLISLKPESESKTAEAELEGLFSDRISSVLWKAQIVNSWDAAVLAARAQMNASFSARKHRIAGQINEELNLFVANQDLDRHSKEIFSPPTLIHQAKSWGVDLSENATLWELVDSIRTWNRKSLNQTSLFVVPLRLTENVNEPKVFMPVGNYLAIEEILAATEIIRIPLSAKEMQKAVEDWAIPLLSLEINPMGEISLVLKKLCRLAGLFVEVFDPKSKKPYLEKEELEDVILPLRANDIPICSVEGPFGLYRTGEFCGMSGSEKGADIYCLGHEISDGTVSAGAIVVQRDTYHEHATRSFQKPVGQYQQKILKTLHHLRNSMPFETCKVGIDLISKRMQELKERYNEVIELSWTGGHTGLIAISAAVGLRAVEFNYLHNHGLLCLALRAYLFHRFKVLVDCVPQSNALLFSLPLTATESQIEELYKALDDGLKLLQSGDIVSLYAPLFPGHKVSPVRPVPSLSTRVTPDTKTVFFAHIAEPRALQLIHSSLRRIPSEVVVQKYGEWVSHISWERALTAHVRGTNGRVTELNVLGFTDTSASILKDIRSGNRRELVAKIQSGIEFASKIGASAVGLGQFTSIVTNNGLMLDPYGLSLTTGNSFTTLLMVRASLRAAEKQGMDLAKSRAAMIGAAGNIVSTAALLLADSVAECWMIYHTLPESSSKLRRMLLGFLNEIKASSSRSAFVLKIKESLKRIPVTDETTLLNFLSDSTVRECFQIHSDLDKVCEADIVLTGTNSPKAFLESRHFKQGAVVVDVGVPNNVDSSLTKERPDIELVRGGMALLPDSEGSRQVIPFPYFPPGESFACMAETLILSLTGVQRLNIGLLSKSRVLETGTLADQVGFGLGSDKVF